MWLQQCLYVYFLGKYNAEQVFYAAQDRATPLEHKSMLFFFKQHLISNGLNPLKKQLVNNCQHNVPTEQEKE